MAENITVARPYAEAAFQRSTQTGSSHAWGPALALAASAVSDPALQRLVTDPRIPHASIQALLTDIGGGRFAGEIGAFLELLAMHERLTLLPEIARLYHELQLAAEGAVDAEIASAYPLTDAQQVRIKARLEQRLQRKVLLQCRVDPALGAGAVIHVGDRVFDGSLRARLSALATHLNQ